MVVITLVSVGAGVLLITLVALLRDPRFETRTLPDGRHHARKVTRWIWEPTPAPWVDGDTAAPWE